LAGPLGNGLSHFIGTNRQRITNICGSLVPPHLAATGPMGKLLAGFLETTNANTNRFIWSATVGRICAVGMLVEG